MSELQAIHRAEQMSAHRRDFLKHWADCILPCLVEAGHSDPKKLARIQIGAWESWLADDFIDRNEIA